MKHNIIHSFTKSKLDLFLLLLVTVFILNSCQKEVNPITKADLLVEFKEVTFRGFPANLPSNFPSEVINFCIEDLKKVALSTPKKGKSNATSKKDLNTIVDEIYGKYPSFDNFDPKAYKKYFPKMSEKEIIENSEIVQSYMEKLMAYDVSETFAKEGDGVLKLKNKNVKQAKVNGVIKDVWNSITQCELWFYLAHLRMNQDGIYYSKARSFEIQEVRQPFVFGLDKSDAFRHGIWGTLVGKYACYRYGTVSEAQGVINGFCDSHECGQNSFDSDMDNFNNLVSQQYYVQIAERYKVNFFDHDVRVTKDDWEIATYINSLPYVKVTSRSEVWNQSLLSLIYID